ncbi:MAG TPA: hypothetical protein VHB46_16895 [Burkholderiales bacterium]|nr:hypothetical protein [Burkholderiales bacterium]
MKIWGWPIVLGLLSAAGLMSALLGDGVWDALSWFTLGAPLAVIAFYVWRPARA